MCMGGCGYIYMGVIEIPLVERYMCACMYVCMCFYIHVHTHTHTHARKYTGPPFLFSLHKGPYTDTGAEKLRGICVCVCVCIYICGPVPT